MRAFLSIVFCLLFSILTFTKSINTIEENVEENVFEENIEENILSYNIYSVTKKDKFIEKMDKTIYENHIKYDVSKVVENISKVYGFSKSVKFNVILDLLDNKNKPTELSFALNENFKPLDDIKDQLKLKDYLKNLENNLKDNFNKEDFTIVLNNIKKNIWNPLNNYQSLITKEIAEGLTYLSKKGLLEMEDKVDEIEEEEEESLLNECISSSKFIRSLIHRKDKLIVKEKLPFNSKFKRTVVVGDIHGDYKKLVEVLRQAKLIDSKNNWIGKDAVLVQVGDLMDRGDDTKKVLDLMIKIKKQATNNVFILLGNHELLNLGYDYSDTTKGDIESFGGLSQRYKEFSINGKYGNLLRKEMNITMILDDNLYVHAGLLPKYAKIGMDQMNERAHTALINSDVPEEEFNYDLPLFDEEVFGIRGGPIWDRSLAEDTEEEVCEKLEETLKITNAKRMIIGHTVQKFGAINTKCENKLILIDVGLTRRYGGYFGYLEMLNNKGEIWARYEKKN